MKFVEVFDGRGLGVDRPDELEGVIEMAFGHQGWSLVEVPTDFIRAAHLMPDSVT